MVTAQGLLREMGKIAAYEEGIAPEARPAVFGIVPGSWIPVETALAHHRAIDGLRLPPSEQITLATGSGEKMQSALTGTILRMSREIGVTPWTLMPHGQRIWDRVCRGGDMSVERVGPKEAVVRMYGLPLFTSSYFRVAVRYVLQSGLSHWCTRGFVTEVPIRRRASRFARPGRSVASSIVRRATCFFGSAHQTYAHGGALRLPCEQIWGERQRGLDRLSLSSRPRSRLAHCRRHRDWQSRRLGPGSPRRGASPGRPTKERTRLAARDPSRDPRRRRISSASWALRRVSSSCPRWRSSRSSVRCCSRGVDRGASRGGGDRTRPRPR